MEGSLSRVAVTGAGGFIGGAVCRRLVADGAEVTGLDLPAVADRVRETGAAFAPCDVTDAAAVAGALRGVPHVVHTAAIVSDWGAMEDSDVLAREGGAAVVRPGDVYGPRSVPWAIRPLRGLRSRRLAIPPRGVITPVYVDDLVELIVLALTHPDAAGQAFVGWEGPPIPVRDFFDRYARMLGRSRAPVLPGPLLKVAAALDEGLARVRRRPPTATRWAIDYLSRTHAYRASRAQEVLGWHPRVDLDEGMRRTAAWARAEGLLH